MNTRLSVVLSAGLALGGALLGANALANDASHPEESSARASGQEHIADLTQKLENAFNEQFARGSIDRSALAGPIHDVVEAMPAAARPKVASHIDDILQTAEKLATQMTPEQRAEAVAPPSAEKIGKTQAAIISAWGWPGAVGWGGYGAFGFPAMYGLGYGNGLGYGWGGTGYGAYGGLGYGAYGGLGWGGLGLGGWYW